MGEPMLGRIEPRQRGLLLEYCRKMQLCECWASAAIPRTTLRVWIRHSGCDFRCPQYPMQRRLRRRGDWLCVQRKAGDKTGCVQRQHRRVGLKTVLLGGRYPQLRNGMCNG